MICFNQWEQLVTGKIGLFFLSDVIEIAYQVSEASRGIAELFDNDKKDNRDKSLVYKLNLENSHIDEKMIFFWQAKRITEEINLSLPTAIRKILIFERLGIVKEITGKERRKVYVYRSYLDFLMRYRTAEDWYLA